VKTLTSEVTMTVTELRHGQAEPHATANAATAPGAGATAVRGLLVRILQDAHAGELAAAYAYRAHARSLWRRPDERAEVRRIEAAEWHHRALVGQILVDLGAGPRRRRELLMGATGRVFGMLCFVTGWFGPMYAAGRLEAMNVDQYRLARDMAATMGSDLHVSLLEAMRVEEVRHERWFGDRVRGHWLLPFARIFLGWSPPPDVRPASHL
jgi:demethoxyubiquinone hydroxylase (CLK1/Coq7/Cat5 family)